MTHLDPRLRITLDSSALLLSGSAINRDPTRCFQRVVVAEVAFSGLPATRCVANIELTSQHSLFSLTISRSMNLIETYSLRKPCYDFTFL